MQRRFPKQLSALADMAAFVDEFALSAGVGMDVTMQIQLIIEELTTNMMKYSVGRGNYLEITLARRPESVSIELVEPDVEEFNPIANAPNLDTTDEADRRAGGMGLFMVRQMADIDYRYSDGTGITTLTLKVGKTHV